jgi:hypothetical protein
MAATAGPKPIGLRLKGGLPLRFQRVRDPRLKGTVHDHRDPERALLDTARLGDIHPPDRPGREDVRDVLNPVGQRELGLGGHHDLAVDTCGQTTSIAFGYPPHAHQSV